MTSSRRHNRTGTITPLAGGAALRALCLAMLALVLLTLPVRAWAVCSCTSGRMTTYYPGTAPVSIDGSMTDWTSIMANPANNICDGPPIPDLDAPIQSTGRDLMQFTYTYDSTYVYAYTERAASESNTDNFIYYADTDNDGLMETGEKVVVVSWQGSNQTVGVSVGTYQARYAGGDPLVCTAGMTGDQTCTEGYADGYFPPGTITNLPSAGHPTYEGKWGSSSGVQMEWRVTWADLGLGATPGRAFTFHVASTNSQPGAGSFPAQVDDNMGGCGGGSGSTQYAGVTLVPDQLITTSTATTYTTTHTLTNTGNGADNYTLGYSISGPNNPAITSVTYLYNGTPFTDTSSVLSSLAAGASMTFTVRYTFSGSPQGKGPYYVTTTATSKYDTSVSASAVDTLTSANAVVIRKQTIGGYGSFSYSGGTNGLPASLTLTTTAANNPDSSQGYIPSRTNTTSSLTETIPTGWRFNSGSCVYAATGTAVSGVTWSSTSTSASFTIPANVYTDTIYCTFVNEKLPTITLSKLLGAPRVNDADQFTLQLKNSSGTVLASSATTGSGSVVDTGTGSLYYSATTTGVSYTLDETKSAGPTPSSVYGATLSCTNNGSSVSTPSALGQSFTPVIGDNYVCYITNTPPTLTVAKQSLGDTGVFSFSGSNGVTPFSLDTTAANPQNTTFVLSALSTTTVTETIPAGWELTSASCINSSGTAISGTTLSNGTLTIPAAAITGGAHLTCTFVDTRLGVNVSGAAYGDANHNAAMDSGESGTGLSLYVKLVPRSGSTCSATATAATAADSSSGAYLFTFVQAGDYCLVLDDNAALSDTTPSYPDGWLGTEQPTGSISLTVGTSALTGQNFGLYHGSSITGRVFSDIGTGAGGIANNGLQDGTEAGLPGVTVALTDAGGGTTHDSAVTDGSGAYTLWLPAAAAGSVTVRETNPSSWLSTGGSAGNTGGSYDRGTDSTSFTASAGMAYSGVTFGDVPPNSFTDNNSGTLVAGGTVTYRHTFTAGSGGTVTFGSSAVATPAISGWSEMLYEDSDCSGTLESGEPQISAPITVAAGQQLCILLQETSPLAATAGNSNSVTVSALFDYVNAVPSMTATYTLTDLSSILQSGLTLIKYVDKASAKPGEVLTYTVTYVNTGFSSLANIIISDTVPTYTALTTPTSSAACCVGPSGDCLGTAAAPYPAAITSCTPATTSSSVTWTLGGTLSPGASGQVKFSVIIDQ